MRKVVLLGLALAVVACDEGKAKDTPEETEVAAAAAEEAKPAEVDVALLKESIASVVVAARESAVGRRKACLEAVPKLEAAKAAEPENKKLATVEGELMPMCFEMAETKKLMKKLAEPRPNVHLSAAFASTFTHDDLKKTFKAVTREAKRRQDPTKKCDEIRVLADSLGSKKKKKTQKLVKKAMAFCDGQAHLLAARYHLTIAAQAIKDDKGPALVESCVHSVKELSAAPAGKLHEKLDGDAAEHCIEAVALKGILTSDAT